MLYGTSRLNHHSGRKVTMLTHDESLIAGKDGLNLSKTTCDIVSKREKVKPGVRHPGLKLLMKWVFGGYFPAMRRYSDGDIP